MERLAKIRGGLIDLGLDAVLITDELNQRYATGFAFTDGAVLVTLDRAFLLTDSRYIEAAQKSVSGDITVRMFGAGKRLSQLVREAMTECSVKMLGAEEFSLSHGAYLNWQRVLGVELHPCQSLFYRLRASKDEAEIRSMRRAQAIAEKALDDVLHIIRPGITERDIAAEISYRMLKHGGEGNSFDPIAVTGANSSMPHGVPSDAVVREGDFITMDFGCRYDGYCSDMTRTVVLGEASSKQKEIYGIVLKAQMAALEQICAGKTGSEVDQVARGLIAEAGYGEYFGHGLGHSVGLFIHEEPRLSPKCHSALQKNMTMTVEPGIYIPEFGGVRIEDLVVITEKGCRNLAHSPKELIEL